MAIIYSYPLAEEVTNGSWVLGSEMDNGIRVVKNYSVGDIASFIQQEYTTIPTLQQVTEEGANTNVQIQIDGVDVATVNDIPGTPTLQEVVSEGNTVSGGTIKVELGSYYTSLEGVSVNVLSSSNLLSLYAGSVLFEKQFGTGSVELRFPNTIDGTRVIEFPNASGTIALTDDLLDYVPYTGATQSIDLGNYDIFTAGNARLGDDGTVYGAELLLYDGPNAGYASIRIDDDYFAVRRSSGNEMLSCDNGSFLILKNAANGAAIISNPHSTQRAYTLPDDNGTFALTKYKVYTALLTQTGTSAPVATVLENTLGATITWSYVGVGQYYATASSAVFTASKTTGILSNSSSTGINAFVNISTTVFNVVTTSSGVAANNELVKNMVEIRVYN